MSSRRGFLTKFLGTGAAALSVRSSLGQKAPTSATALRRARETYAGTEFNVPVQRPDIPDLPFTTDGGVKVFHLVAEPVKQQIAPDKVLTLWGYNGSAPGPQSRSIRVTGFASLSTIICLSQRPCIGMDLKSPTTWMVDPG